MEIICSHEECTGCMACANACAHQAIVVRYDKEGFERPFILSDKCIDCGLCKKVCPINNLPELSQEPLKIFSGWISDEHLRLESSSGGAFSALAIPILRQGGVVFGVTLNDEFEVEHTFIEKESDLVKLRGSKYVQSSVGESYKQARVFLREGRKVLFSGTPCQIAGLRNYLHRDYDNLITVDLICHGVPSPKVFEDWKKWFKKKYNLKDISSIGFRGKKSSWIFFHMTVTGHVEKSNASFHYEGKYYEDRWIRGFLRDYFLRPSCHQCKFTKTKRVSDFTIADWWGYKAVSKEDKYFEQKGVSLILCNTQNGLTYFKKECSSTLTIKERNLTDALKTNISLQKSFCVSPKRNEFWKDYDVMSFEELAEKYMYPECIPLSLLLRSSCAPSFLRDSLIFFVGKSENMLRRLHIRVPRFRANLFSSLHE